MYATWSGVGVPLWLLAAFPFAYFFGALYTESLFLLLALLAFYAIERQKWGLAACMAFVAGATRPTGPEPEPATPRRRPARAR